MVSRCFYLQAKLEKNAVGHKHEIERLGNSNESKKVGAFWNLDWKYI